jgi:hypothetical protein
MHILPVTRKDSRTHTLHRSSSIHVSPAPSGLDAFGNVNSEGVHSLTRVLGQSPRLSILKLARNHLHDQDAILLSECLCAMPGLQELDLAGNCIGPSGVQALKLFIVGHSNLKET